MTSRGFPRRIPTLSCVSPRMAQSFTRTSPADPFSHARAAIPSEYVPELLQAWATGEIRQVEASDGKKVFDFTIAPVPGRGYINLYGRDVTEEKSLAAKIPAGSEDGSRRTACGRRRA